MLKRCVSMAFDLDVGFIVCNPIANKCSTPPLCSVVFSMKLVSWATKFSLVCRPISVILTPILLDFNSSICLAR
ncbi:unnamed protein product [Brassica oleracea]